MRKSREVFAEVPKFLFSFLTCSDLNIAVHHTPKAYFVNSTESY